MIITYQEFEQNILNVSDDLAVQENLRESIPKGIMSLDKQVIFWKELVEYSEAEIAYESIIALINSSPCNLKGRNVIKLIEVALFLNDYIDYEFVFSKPVIFTDDKKMILSEEDFNHYLMDVIDDLSLQKRFEDSMPKQGVLAYETIIGLLNKYPCKLDGKNVVKLIFIALSLGDDINYESLLKK